VNMDLFQKHEGEIQVTITHRLDPAQFAVLPAFLTALISTLGGVDDAKIVALTSKLKESAETLQGALQQTPTT
jgi:hypothetical protein